MSLFGADEGARLEQAVGLLLSSIGGLPDIDKPQAANILWSAGRYEAARFLGDLPELARCCDLSGLPGVNLVARVETDADRRELIRHHRMWAEKVEAKAAERPLIRPPSDRPRPPFRLGLLSSDLRQHVVGFFAAPLFEHPDPRFELYCYSSLGGKPDRVRLWFEERATAYRQLPPDDHEAAAMIAADDLDMLIDLGGPTPHNRPALLAYRAAPVQACWLGYPHSLGLSAIDYLIVDPSLAPPRREFLTERALSMPSSWVCMSEAAFPMQPAHQPTPPVARTGRITFGTANDPYKYSPKVLGAWAKVVAAVPGARFMIVRPEAGAPSFRNAVASHFAAEGVSADRLDFRPLRGAVRASYADMDIALDTFPVTGGTTTCEALWYGVPTVTLVGEALYERLSWALLAGVGLGDLAATNLEDYVRIAVRLANDPARIADLRATMRDRIQASPLGQPQRFAADYYDLMARAVAERGQAR